MLFSGKITNSVITFLQNRGEELPDFYELTELPLEFLKDPSCWLDANRVDAFLAHIENWYLLKGLENPIEHIGHSSKDLKAWGVLDSVLRMIEKPHDIFLQPQRFISYFISPAPPIANIRRGESMVGFDIPISIEEYPHAASYIKSAIESIPLFMGLPMAEASWQVNRISVSWSQSQAAFGESALERRQMAPEVVENLLSTLEKTEQALLAKTRELDKIKYENALAAQSQPLPSENLVAIKRRTDQFQQHVMKLQDYFTRSQQLITLLIGQDRMSPQVREAMKRVNWDHVQSSFPEITRELLNDQPSANSTTHVPAQTTTENKESFYGKNHASHSERDTRQPWLSNS